MTTFYIVLNIKFIIEGTSKTPYFTFSFSIFNVSKNANEVVFKILSSTN